MRAISVTTYLCVALALTFTSTAHSEDLDTKPNFLIIVTDDQGYADLSAFEHHAKDVSTPNMDRLAARGVPYGCKRSLKCAAFLSENKGQLLC